MNAIKIPGFTAETSLFRRSEDYTLRSLSSTAADDKTGAVYPARYACGRGLCACSGDEDCNGMFSHGCSSGGYAQCWIRSNDSNVFCLCT